MRVRALGGVVGPVAFVATWAVLGARSKGYSPVEEPVSRLAAVGSPTSRGMTVGILAFGAGVAAYASALRQALPGGAPGSALVCAVATAGIAATPLDSPLGGTPHAVAAGIAYASLAGTPILAAATLAKQRRTKTAAISVLAGVGCAVCLATSAVTESRTGLWQRAGFVIGDAWLAGSALVLYARYPARVRRL